MVSILENRIGNLSSNLEQDWKYLTLYECSCEIHEYITSFIPGEATSLGEGKLWIQTSCTQTKN